MGQEKQRISERLARVDTEREKLSDQLKELEFAERVLARFREKAVTTKKRRRESTPSHWSADTAPCRSSHRLSAPPARGSADLGIYAAFIGIIGTVKPAARVRSSVGIPYQRTTASSEQHD